MNTTFQKVYSLEPGIYRIRLKGGQFQEFEVLQDMLTRVEISHFEEVKNLNILTLEKKIGKFSFDDPSPYSEFPSLQHQFLKSLFLSPHNLQTYLIQEKNKTYSGFRYFVPPGTIKLIFYFQAIPIIQKGPQIYVSIRLDEPPEISFLDFHSNTFALDIEYEAPTMTKIQTIKGYLGQRKSLDGEFCYLHREYNKGNEILPKQFQNTGSWIYVKFYNEKGESKIDNIVNIIGIIDVIPEKYEKWLANVS
jgi:hypothetical protein